MSLLAQDLFDVPEKEKERFKITDLGSLSWVFRKLASIEKKKAEINHLADEEIKRIEAFRTTELTGLSHDETYFRSLIEEYALRQRESDPEFKKASTPYGSVKLKKQRPKWTYDEEKLVQSLKTNNMTDLIRIKEEPNKDGLREHMKVSGGKVIDPATGMILEGVAVEEQPDKIVLEVKP